MITIKNENFPFPVLFFTFPISVPWRSQVEIYARLPLLSLFITLSPRPSLRQFCDLPNQLINCNVG